MGDDPRHRRWWSQAALGLALLACLPGGDVSAAVAALADAGADTGALRAELVMLVIAAPSARA